MNHLGFRSMRLVHHPITNCVPKLSSICGTFWVQAIVPLSSPKFLTGTLRGTMACTQHIPYHNGFHDLHNGHVSVQNGHEDFELGGKVTQRPQKTCSLCLVMGVKRGRKGHMKTIMYQRRCPLECILHPTELFMASLIGWDLEANYDVQNAP